MINDCLTSNRKEWLAYRPKNASHAGGTPDDMPVRHRLRRNKQLDKQDATAANGGAV